MSHNHKQNFTSISAALSCPKKTFLINFPSKNTSTKAWMYNTWYKKQQKSETALAQGHWLRKCWRILNLLINKILQLFKPESRFKHSSALVLPPCWDCSWWGRRQSDKTDVWGGKHEPPQPQSVPDWWQSPALLVPFWNQPQILWRRKTWGEKRKFAASTCKQVCHVRWHYLTFLLAKV